MTASAISRESGKGCESFQYRILADMNLAEEAGTGNPRRDSETARAVEGNRGPVRDIGEGRPAEWRGGGTPENSVRIHWPRVSLRRG